MITRICHTLTHGTPVIQRRSLTARDPGAGADAASLVNEDDDAGDAPADPHPDVAHCGVPVATTDDAHRLNGSTPRTDAFALRWSPRKQFPHDPDRRGGNLPFRILRCHDGSADNMPLALQRPPVAVMRTHCCCCGRKFSKLYINSVMQLLCQMEKWPGSSHQSGGLPQKRAGCFLSEHVLCLDPGKTPGNSPGCGWSVAPG